MFHFSKAYCLNGDVKLLADGTPLIWWKNTWANICGHGFWYTQEGAKLFCQKMGYEDGSVSKRDSVSPRDSFQIGKCDAGDTLENCRGGCNGYKIGGPCSDYSEGQTCNAWDPDNLEIAITCTGWNSIARTSCGSITLKISYHNFNSQKKTAFYSHPPHSSPVSF